MPDPEVPDRSAPRARNSLRGTTGQNVVASVIVAFVVALNLYWVIDGSFSVGYATYDVLRVIGLLVGIRLFFWRVIRIDEWMTPKKRPK